MAPPSLTIEMNYNNLNNFAPFLPTATSSPPTPTTGPFFNIDNNAPTNIVAPTSNAIHAFSTALSTPSFPPANTSNSVFSTPNTSTSLFPPPMALPLPIPTAMQATPQRPAARIIAEMQADARSKAENNYRTDPKLIEQNKVPGKKLHPSERKKRLRNKSAYISRHKERYYISFMQHRITRNEAEMAKHTAESQAVQAQIAYLKKVLNNHNHNSPKATNTSIPLPLTTIPMNTVTMNNFGVLEEAQPAAFLPPTTTSRPMPTFPLTSNPMAISMNSAGIAFQEKNPNLHINQDHVQMQRDAGSLLEAPRGAANNARARAHYQNIPPPMPAVSGDSFDPFSFPTTPSLFAPPRTSTVETRPNRHNQQLQELDAALLAPHNSWDSNVNVPPKQ